MRVQLMSSGQLQFICGLAACGACILGCKKNVVIIQNEGNVALWPMYILLIQQMLWFVMCILSWFTKCWSEYFKAIKTKLTTPDPKQKPKPSLTSSGSVL